MVFQAFKSTFVDVRTFNFELVTGRNPNFTFVPYKSNFFHLFCDFDYIQPLF